ncbi:MAG TPA: sigma 54-interacting transcriptional regulator [Gemmataceae bacterium]|nr:sigma 54-interacting transcriptional regulator [Gemmataceae bacterium]
MNGEPLRVLVIDDEEHHAEAVAESLQRVGYECVVATSGAAGARKIEQDEFDVVLTDLRMEDMDGLAILRKARQELPDAEVVVITGHGDVKTAVEAMQQGAANYLEKPVDLTELRTIVDKAAERLRLVRANRELKRQLDEKFGFEGVIGNSPKMHEVISKLKSIAPTSATVLIHGETGTGKELVARAIHNNSPRKHKPFVAMNCTALNENLLEDELFGHEPGAFTGADRLRKGRFEHANGGTLFLDEVGDMPPALQAKLLRVLENQEVFRIGSNEPIKVNVRLLSATNRDLEAAVANGQFRQDLYYRLKVVTVKLPPLRERREDIPLLVAHFIKEFNQRHGKHVQGVAEPVRKAMLAYDWPGNVRELRNLVESMVVQDRDGLLGMDDLQESDTLHRLHPADGPAAGPTSLVGRPLTEVERYYTEKALELTAGNREEAARLLGIGERTLYRNIQNWKQQDRIRQVLHETDGNVEAAAKTLGMRPEELTRKLKKWGVQSSST